MRKPCPSFPPPDDVNATIWRYMDLSIFLHLIDTSSLHFTRADSLDDSFEGSLPKPNVELMQRSDEQRQDHIHEMNMKFGETRKLSPYSEFMKELLTKQCVNCWHLNDYESQAMWKLYLKSDEGIAIRSTFKHLIGCFDKSPELLVSAGMVQYIDYETEFLRYSNIFVPIMHKRVSYKHECELRVVIISGERNERGNACWTNAAFDERGKDVAIDVACLIDEVILAPLTQPWFERLVNSILEKLDYSIPVRRSSLADGPFS